MSPPAGSTDAPLNPEIVYFSGISLFTLVERAPNLAVPITIEPFPGVERVWLVRPNQLLRPNTTYELQGGSGTGSGLFTFTTGTSTDDETPTYGGITSFSAGTTDPGNDCRSSCSPPVGHLRRVRLDFPPPPADISLLLLETRAPDATAVTTIPIFRFRQPDWPRLHDNEECGFGVPTFEPGESICARIVAVDMAGHRAEPSSEICARPVACPPLTRSCTWSEECRPLDGGPGGPDDAGPARAGASCDCSLAGNESHPVPMGSLLTSLTTAAAFVRRRRKGAPVRLRSVAR